jgi:hypothetical protein
MIFPYLTRPQDHYTYSLNYSKLAFLYRSTRESYFFLSALGRDKDMVRHPK